MAIVIRELIASDTLSQAVDKINFNFDQLLLNGGGPSGPAGPAGPIGPIGGRGIRGSIWYEGTADPNVVPPTLTPEDEDNYLRSNGTVWTYNEASTTWVFTGVNLTGPQGPAGASGKFGEYGGIQPGPYVNVGDTTIYPDPIVNDITAFNQGVRATVLGGFPEPPGMAAPPFPTGNSVISTAIAQQAFMPQVTLLLHQFDDGGSSIVFHGGDTSQNFEQGSFANLANIGLNQDDILEFRSPKQATLGTSLSTIEGLRMLTAKRGQFFQSGKHIKFQTGAFGTSYGVPTADEDDFIVEVNSATPGVSPQFKVDVLAGDLASLEMGDDTIAPTTTTNTGNFYVQAGKISLVGSGEMNLRTSDAINAIATQSIAINSTGGSIGLTAASNVNIFPTNNMNINAGNNAIITAADDIVATATNGDVSILTGVGSGGAINLITNNNNTNINLSALGTSSDINLTANTVGGAINLDASSGSITGSALLIDLNALLFDLDASGVEIDTSSGSIILTSASEINLNANGEIEITSDTDSVILQSAATSEHVILRRVSGTSTSVIKVYSGGPTSGSYFDIHNGEDGTSPGIRLSMGIGDNTTGDILAIGTTDKLRIYNFTRVATASGGGQELGIEVSGTIDVDGNDQINAQTDEKIFASGTFSNDTVADWGSVIINWQRVGNIVTGSGIVGSWAGGLANFDAPVVGATGITDVYGVFNRASSGDIGGIVGIGTIADTILLSPSISGFDALGIYQFTFSYRLV